MNQKALRISCSVFAFLIIGACVAMLYLEITGRAPSGQQGDSGQAGEDEVLVPASVSTFTANPTPDGDFTVPPLIFFQQNTKEKIVSSSFTLTALVNNNLGPGELLPLFNLSLALYPSFEAGALGFAWNVLDSNVQHVVFFDSSENVNVSFLTTASVNIAQNDRFVVSIMYVR